MQFITTIKKVIILAWIGELKKSSKKSNIGYKFHNLIWNIINKWYLHIFQWKIKNEMPIPFILEPKWIFISIYIYIYMGCIKIEHWWKEKGTEKLYLNHKKGNWIGCLIFLHSEKFD